VLVLSESIGYLLLNRIRICDLCGYVNVQTHVSICMSDYACHGWLRTV
jgi:hypothetical protein